MENSNIQSKNPIVLGADSNYMDKVETTVKSVCSHNRDIRFYIFNSDFPTEWFQLMNKRLSVLNSEIINIKITDDTISRFHLPTPHLSSATYLRYFIPNFVFEKKVLYLDSDIIVTSSLTTLFELDLDGYPLGAVPDIPISNEEFNAGVLLIDTDMWRDENISRQLFELTIAHHEHVYGDQGIFNILFKDRWKRLDLTYNLQVGQDAHRHYLRDFGWYELFDGIPNIIHYTTENKPWKHFRFNRFREIWWFYYGLNWNDVLLETDIIRRSFAELVKAPLYHTCIFTNSAGLESIEYILSELPEVHVTILAPTDFAESVVDMQRFLNLSIYPNFSPFNKKETLDKMDFYLDINHGGVVGTIIEEIHDKNKPIFAFDTTSHDSSGRSQIFSSAEPEKMIDGIRKFLGEKTEWKMN